MQAEARAWNRRKCSKCGLRDCAAAGEWWNQPANGGIKKTLVVGRWPDFRATSTPVGGRGLTAFAKPTGLLASTREKPHIRSMSTATKKKAGSRRRDAPKGAVVYRGVKIIPKTGKRSPIAKVIRDGLRTKSEQSHGETSRR